MTVTIGGWTGVWSFIEFGGSGTGTSVLGYTSREGDCKCVSINFNVLLAHPMTGVKELLGNLCLEIRRVGRRGLIDNYVREILEQEEERTKKEKLRVT